MRDVYKNSMQAQHIPIIWKMFVNIGDFCQVVMFVRHLGFASEWPLIGVLYRV